MNTAKQRGMLSVQRGLFVFPRETLPVTVRKSSDWPTGVLLVLETHSFASGLDGECIILGDNKLFSICAGWTKNKGN